MSRQIGSVEIKRLRVYPADPNDPSSPDVTVTPGIFPVMRSGDRIWWPMRGVVSVRRPVSEFERIGDGMFAFTPAGDELTGEVRSITSKEFTPQEFADLMADPFCEDGPEQRLAIKLLESLEAVSA